MTEPRASWPKACRICGCTEYTDDWDSEASRGIDKRIFACLETWHKNSEWGWFDECEHMFDIITGLRSKLSLYESLDGTVDEHMSIVFGPTESPEGLPWQVIRHAKGIQAKALYFASFMDAVAYASKPLDTC
jgi:hypothetical protein